MANKEKRYEEPEWFERLMEKLRRSDEQERMREQTTDATDGK